MLKSKILGGFFSSTMWFGFAVMVINWLNNNTEFIASYFPTEYADLVGYAVGALIWFFRWLTSEAVEDKIPTALRPMNAVEEALQADDDFITGVHTVKKPNQKTNII